MQINNKAYLGFVALILAGVVCIAFDHEMETTTSPPVEAPSIPPEAPNQTFEKADTKKVYNIRPNPARVILLFTEVTNGSLNVAHQITALSRESKAPIYLLIDSPGGSVMDGAQILSAMEASKAPVYTVCMRMCASMAAIIHQYGTKRFAQDRAFLMFHPASAATTGEVDKMVSRALFMQRYVGKMDAYIAKKAGYSTDEFKALTTIEHWIDAEDSKVDGFVDEIVSIDYDFPAQDFLPPPQQNYINLDWK